MARYTQQQIDFLRSERPKLTRSELTQAFNARFGTAKTEGAIKSALKVNNIKCGRTGGEVTGAKLRGKSKLFTPEQVEFIKANYADLGRKGLHQALCKKYSLTITLGQLIAFVKNNKIHSGRTGHYPKGHVPWIKGKGGMGLIKANSGSFKKGERPVNHKPLGHERIDANGYTMVKVAEQNPWGSSQSGLYRHKQCLVWEEHHGPIPEGMIVRFKTMATNGQPHDCSIENLVLVNRGEHIRLNQLGYSNQPEELKPAVLGIARLEQAVHERVSR